MKGSYPSPVRMCFKTFYVVCSLKTKKHKLLAGFVVLSLRNKQATRGEACTKLSDPSLSPQQSRGNPLKAAVDRRERGEVIPGTFPISQTKPGSGLCKPGTIALFGNVVYSGLLNERFWHVGVPLVTRLVSS
ncbi:hypothetical protein PAMP_010769 [Pampus punctatissimus]